MGKGAQSDGVESEPREIVDDINTLVAEPMPLRRQVGFMGKKHALLQRAVRRYQSFQEACS
jgi:hypothetical protein